MIGLSDIAEQGEESGREEAACDYPFLPDPLDYRELRQYGRGRAQGLYRLRGKAARVFAHNWSIGYIAECNLYKLVCSAELQEAQS
jgi:hypothetical protein